MGKNDLFPEQKLAVAVIGAWISDFKLNLKHITERHELWKWPDTGDAEFWCDVCGGQVHALRAWRDDVWSEHKKRQRKKTEKIKKRKVTLKIINKSTKQDGFVDDFTTEDAIEEVKKILGIGGRLG